MKTVWIVGASSGIGHALAKKMLMQGWQVILSARRREPLDELAQQYPQRTLVLPMDISIDDDIDRTVQNIDSKLASIDCLVLSAGMCEYMNGAPEADSARTHMQVNYLGNVRVIELALPLLLKAEDKPQLIGIGSLAADVAFPRAEYYGASKAAFQYFLESLRIDWGSKLDITVVSPGFVDTPLVGNNDFPMPQLMDAEQAADSIYKAVMHRKASLRFPFALAATLQTARIFSPLWQRWVAPRLSRQSGTVEPVNEHRSDR